MNNKKVEFDEVEFDIDVYFNGEEINENQDVIGSHIIKCLGIDLGTTNSCVAIWDEEGRSIQIIPDKMGNRTMPSIVSFTNFNYYVGHEAKNQLELNPQNTFYEVKRLIGKKITDPSVIADSKFISYKLDKNYERDENNVHLCLSNEQESTNYNQPSAPRRGQFKKKYTPEEISSIILSKLKDIYLHSSHASNQDNITLPKVVITVPAYFNTMQRKATLDAATIAGFDCIKIINEPTAAACAYGLEVLSRDKNINLNVIVYDLGGGTLDVTLLNISNGIIEVLGCCGDPHLGGSDFDKVLMMYCIECFIKKNKLESCGMIEQLSPLVKQKLKISCENAKIKLSTNDFANIHISDFWDNLSLQVKITREKYEKLCNSLLLLCIEPIAKVIQSSDHLKAYDINEIILVGGGTRMPMIKKSISAFFGNKQLNDNINPDEVVACGAALHGHTLCNKHTSISDNILLLDIIPLSLGVETLNNLMNVIIPRNTTIPCSKRKKYTTCDNNTDYVDIKIFEGERELTKDNFLIGSFRLEGIEREMKCIPEINVTFTVDANGIVNVLAEDAKNKDNKKSITVNSNTTRLTKEEIDRMILDSVTMKERDKEFKEKRELYYAIHDMCSNVLANLEEIKDKITEEKLNEVKQTIEDTINKLKSKTFDVHTKQDYKNLSNMIKSKYGTLILKLNKDNMNFQESINNTKIKGTNIYDDDDDNEDYCLVDEKEDDDTEDIDKVKLLEVKNTLIELCNSTLSIVMNEDTGLLLNDIIFLREYVDDCMMWLYVTHGLTLEDYENKITEFNDTCNEIMNKYDSSSGINEIQQQNNLELAILLFNLLNNLSNKGVIPEYEKHIKKLEEIINDKGKNQDSTIDSDDYLNNLVDLMDNIQLY